MPGGPASLPPSHRHSTNLGFTREVERLAAFRGVGAPARLMRAACGSGRPTGVHRARSGQERGGGATQRRHIVPRRGWRINRQPGRSQPAPRSPRPPGVLTSGDNGQATPRFKIHLLRYLLRTVETRKKVGAREPIDAADGAAHTSTHDTGSRRVRSQSRALSSGPQHTTQTHAADEQGAQLAEVPREGVARSTE